MKYLKDPFAVCVAVLEPGWVLKETEKAIQIYHPDIAPTWEWIPKSVIHAHSPCGIERSSGPLIVELWFAQTKGWD